MQFNNARRYLDCLDNPSKLLTLSPSNKANAMKSLICLSKYTGIYLQYKEKLRQYDIKWVRPDAFESFIRIMNNNHSDLLKWYNKVCSMLGDNGKLFKIHGAVWIKNEGRNGIIQFDH